MMENFPCQCKQNSIDLDLSSDTALSRDQSQDGAGYTNPSAISRIWSYFQFDSVFDRRKLRSASFLPRDSAQYSGMPMGRTLSAKWSSVT